MKKEKQRRLFANEKKQNIRRKDFLAFAGIIGLEEKIAGKMIEKIRKLESRYLDICAGSFMPDDMKEALSDLIRDRLAML